MNNFVSKISAIFFSSLMISFAGMGQSGTILVAGEAVSVDITNVNTNSLRVTVKPLDSEKDFPGTPVLIDRDYPAPLIHLVELDGQMEHQVGDLLISLASNPLTLRVENNGRLVQEVAFHENGEVRFHLDEYPVLGLGEGGPLPDSGEDWRSLPVEYDRRGRFHQMRPRWQADAYGSRNPVPLLIGTEGWGLYIVSPWGEFDLSEPDRGTFNPIDHSIFAEVPQNRENQHGHQGKGIPPQETLITGYYDLFIFDANDPVTFMKELAAISGQAVLPPRWALGYMQSHRTLEDDGQMLEIVKTFREKKIPIDAVIYLGTGFTPRGWNMEQPSFDFNPEVFQHRPEEVIADLHDLDVKVILHMVPWNRDQLPTLHGTIPPGPDELLDAGHIVPYWQQHVPLVKAGIDAWWPDEGDWFNLYERIKRHQMYYQGALATTPNIRPWSLHRNGYLGIARWGGWVWSGDTESTWKSLEAQIAVGINHSLSLSPFWGSDIGGFFPTEALDGELYTRWFQFAAFTPSFRAHGRTWWTRLPWGWGLSERGPLESNTPPLESALNDTKVEPIVKRFAELRYQLLSYNYSLAWEARESGLPMIRSLWLHYPEDPNVRELGDQYLWGRDLLIAPVYKPGVSSRGVYLPEGEWYDWWTGKKILGGKKIEWEVDLATMPVFIRAGAILPIDPLRQYASQEVEEPLTVSIYRGANGDYSLYEDDGSTLDYLSGAYSLIHFNWDDVNAVLTVEPGNSGGFEQEQQFRIMIFPEEITRNIEYSGERLEIRF